jgi:hypothetical protein
VTVIESILKDLETLPGSKLVEVPEAGQAKRTRGKDRWQSRMPALLLSEI